jgi:UDPglucose 6-dehydrogenase
MKITVMGVGYVGLVSGACLAEMGNDVLCMDVDARKIELLRGGEVPIYEPGLAEVVRRNAAVGRLHFSTDIEEAVRFGTIVFIAVGTPPCADGAADLKDVLAAARNIGRHMTDYKVVVDKSTVPVGTADAVRRTIEEALAERGVEVPFAVVSNPEFLKEGAAVEDFMRPDRIIIGADDQQAILHMRALYSPFQRNHERLVLMDVRSAELSKYAANAMLATRISFMNEMALLAERVGADIEMVRQGIGSDPRIGYHFLYAGCGYGGSCFPKDVKALIKTAANEDLPLQVLQAVESANERQKHVLVDKVLRRFGPDLGGRRFALWGLAFKPDTDDMREAPSLVIVHELLKRSASIVAYDPVAMPDARRRLAGVQGIEYAESPLAAAEGADALLVVTEWKEFRSPDFARLRSVLKQPVVFDGRNVFQAELAQAAGLEVHGIGRSAAALRSAA